MPDDLFYYTITALGVRGELYEHLNEILTAAGSNVRFGPPLAYDGDKKPVVTSIGIGVYLRLEDKAKVFPGTRLISLDEALELE